MRRQSHILRILRLSLAVCLAVMLTSEANAARVSRSKGKAVEIELSSSDDFVKGDRVVFSKDGKKVGIAKITSIKGRKALGRIQKGKAPTGSSVALAKSGSGSSSETAEVPSSGQSDLIVGALLGYSMDTQDVKLKSTTGSVTETVPMSGSGFSLKGYADLTIADELGMIGRAGVETFNTTGTSRVLSCGANCKTEITYLTADLLVRYNLAPGNWNPFVAGGLGIYFPMSKKTSILEESKIASTTVFIIAGGANIVISKGMFVPVNLEYGLFPPSNDVSTNFISVRSGIGYAF